MKKTTTYKQLFEVVETINGMDGSIDDMLSRKIVRFMKNIQPVIEDYNEEADDIAIEVASKDKSGRLERDANRDLMFTPDQIKERNKRIKQLRSRQVEVNVVRCEDRTRIDALQVTQKIALNGFVFEIPEFNLEEEQVLEDSNK